MTRDEFIGQWEGEFVPYDAIEFRRDLNALLDAERAKAREEQREADAMAIYGPAVAEVAARVEELEAFAEKIKAERDEARAESAQQRDRVASLECDHIRWLTESAEWKARALKAEEAADLMARHRYLAGAVATDTATYDEALELGAIRERLDADEWKERAVKAEEALAVQVRERQARVAAAVAALSEIIARQKSARDQGRMPDIERDHEAADEALLACLGDDEVRDQFAAIEMWYA